MARETREERAERFNSEQRTKRVAEFKAKINSERCRRVYSERAAFDANRQGEDRSAIAIYEVVREFKTSCETLRKLIDRMAERMTEATTRLDRGENPFWHSTAMGDLPADIERANARRTALAESVHRLAWATNWYVADVLTDRERERRDLLVSLDVVTHPTISDRYAVGRATTDALFYHAVVDGIPSLTVLEADAQAFETEEAAWLAAMALCGERP